MTAREALHQIVDGLPENELPTATRVLEALSISSDPLARTLLRAPLDDESGGDDFDGGLTQARREAREGDHISQEELEVQLSLR